MWPHYDDTHRQAAEGQLKRKDNLKKNHHIKTSSFTLSLSASSVQKTVQTAWLNESCWAFNQRILIFSFLVRFHPQHTNSSPVLMWVRASPLGATGYISRWHVNWSWGSNCRPCGLGSALNLQNFFWHHWQEADFQFGCAILRVTLLQLKREPTRSWLLFLQTTASESMMTMSLGKNVCTLDKTRLDKTLTALC